jgi:hypothetical protein
MVKISSLCGLLLLGTASVVSAKNIDFDGPGCATGSLATYIALGSSGCSISPFVFSSFNFARVGTGAGLGINENNITVTPTSDFTTPFTFTSGNFHLTGEDTAIVQINFLIDPPPPIVPGFQLDLFTATPSGGGQAIVDADLCVGGLFLGTACTGGGTFFSLEVFYKSFADGSFTAKLSDTVKFEATLIDVRETVTLLANGGIADITGFGNKFAPVPEPATIGVIGAGLVVLGLLRRRRP